MWESLGQKVTPASLYMAQKSEATASNPAVVGPAEDAKATPCPTLSSGSNVLSGCTCNQGYTGTIVATVTAPSYFSGTCGEVTADTLPIGALRRCYGGLLLFLLILLVHQILVLILMPIQCPNRYPLIVALGSQARCGRASRLTSTSAPSALQIRPPAPPSSPTSKQTWRPRS